MSLWLLPIFCLALPCFGHASAIAAHSTISRSIQCLTYPLRGGIRHISYQVAAAVLWFTALASSCLRFSSEHAHLHPAAFHISWVLALIALFFFIKAQLLHQNLLQRQRCRKTLLAGIALLCMGVGAAGSVQIMLMRSSHAHEYEASDNTLPSASTNAWLLFGSDPCNSDSAASVSSQGSWQTVQHSSFFSAEQRYANVAQALLALVCTVSASMSAHGAAGYVLHHHGTSKKRASTWAFFQPFNGGAAFIAVQFLGWSLFTGEVVGLLHLALSVGRGLVVPKYSWTLAAGMVLIPVLLAASALSFQERTRREAQSNHRDSASIHDIPFIRRWHLLISMYAQVHVYVALLVVPHTLMPQSWRSILSVQVLLHFVYYACTLPGDPALTGCRTHKASLDWIRSQIGPVLEWWMRGCEVTKCFEGSLDPEKRYIFAYMPHGMLPAGVVYMPFLPSWRQQFPGLEPVGLTASVIHWVPFMRDAIQLLGGREITKRSFRHALKTHKHVTFSPGGQAELLYCSDIFCKQQPAVNLCTRHKGFCREAIAHGAAVVPVINYGEVFQVRNAFNWRWLQRRTYKLIGFPIPYLLHGFWGTPLSRRRPAWLVVGEPVWADDSKSGTEAVDDLHSRFYAGVEQLWMATRSKAPGYEHHRLVFDSQY